MTEIDERIKWPKEWCNFGDANPERHGGIFVKWEIGMYHIIETRHYAELPDGVTESEHMFGHMYMEPEDIWVNGNPFEGFTEWALNRMEEFHRPPFQVSNDPDLPDEVTFKEHMEWLLNNQIEWIVSNLSYAFKGYYGGYDTDFQSNYWGYLEDYGIDPSDF